jgi:hypothetical protein
LAREVETSVSSLEFSGFEFRAVGFEFQRPGGAQSSAASSPARAEISAALDKPARGV